MKEYKEHNYLKYFIFAAFLIFFARFVFTGKVVEIVDAFKPFVAACVFIYLFSPVVTFINEKTRFNRTLSVVTTYVLFLLLVSLFMSMLVPSIIDSIKMLIDTVSAYEESTIIEFVQKIPFLSRFVDTSNLSNFIENLESLVVDYSSNIIEYSGNVLSSIGSFVKSVVVFAFALVMSFYALKDMDNMFERVSNVIKAFFPEKHSSTILKFAQLTDYYVKKYLIGKLYSCLILSLIIGLSIAIVNMVTPLHIPYAILIAVIVGIFNIIPFIGGFMGTVPSVIIALFSGVWEAVVILLIIIIAQQIDNIIVSPKIIGDSVGLKPFWVIVSITVAGSLFGILGMILAVPLTSVILHVIDEKVEDYKKEQEILNKEAEKEIEE